ncbi:bifunctional hydroxymethylpyrimidine kinase/phosphomethylpyrimidine kinase [Paenibacillus sp. JX-17]|uniref:Hydroxymethylpyrimidine/phosphomethylpyrimidine kinase n=1 Tax=Paenibacillus lacisoli TaxID=3064525 RepID=A0ABT9CB41_9BACL|nr:bifunctional hydroxymethylpyrimidine kinase/phosphomethylpyrimidine kinase [Paenibacillus sp. JX-17]MDO7906466.1 bifunctional hydroxymethylpyrimidine kinase/phosphomethylpyrimidine kinase [Paenibacillus sp. JX-17]
MKIAKALTIAGSDSGGGAGIQADLKTFQELGVYGMSALTAVTAQNTLGVQGVYPLEEDAVVQQLRSVGSDLPPDAVKTGMLYSAEIVRAAAGEIAALGWAKVVVDPVMIAKGGSTLLQQEAVSAVIESLLPVSLVVTPNIPEAEALTGVKITALHSKLEAARRLQDYGARYVIIKGGHDGDPDTANDLVYDGSGFTELPGTRIRTSHTHGTGCTFSAAIAAGLAKGLSVMEAAGLAKEFIQAAIQDSLAIGGGHGPTNQWAYRLRTDKSVGNGGISRE